MFVFTAMLHREIHACVSNMQVTNIFVNISIVESQSLWVFCSDGGFCYMKLYHWVRYRLSEWADDMLHICHILHEQQKHTVLI